MKYPDGIYLDGIHLDNEKLSHIFRVLSQLMAKQKGDIMMRLEKAKSAFVNLQYIWKNSAGICNKNTHKDYDLKPWCPVSFP